MKPLIGVSPSFHDKENVYQTAKANALAIERAGGIPLLLTYMTDHHDLDELVDRLDGLYLTGGGDIDPIYFDEEPHARLGTVQPERDAFELAIAKKMLEKDKPIFGVCKGSQILNVAAGGDIYQDIHSQIEGELMQHSQKKGKGYPSHWVEVVKGSLLHQLTGEEKIRVNSFHHQAIRKPAENFIVTASAGDGVVEAIESETHRFALGVQWHPETLAIDGNDEISKKIFRGFIAACEKEVGTKLAELC